MTNEERRICMFIQEHQRLDWLTTDEIHKAYRDTLFYARVGLHLAVQDFKKALRELFC